MNRYKLMRYEAGLDRPVVSQETGVPVRTLRHLESEKEGYTPSPATAKALADFYGKTLPEFLGVTEEAA